MKSMTAFARESVQIDDTNYVLEMRAVNGRFREMSVRLPFHLRDLEDPVRSVTAGRIERGRVQISLVSVQPESRSQKLQVNLELARQYAEGFRVLKDELGISGEADISVFARIKDLMVLQAPEPETDRIWTQFLPFLERVLESLNQMRLQEGRHLSLDLTRRLETLDGLLERIQNRAGEIPSAYAKRMAERIQEFLGGVEVDTDRVVQEAAVWAERSDITEELVRADSHLRQFRTIMAQDEPVGRKLDFLVQELHREINTIGAKAQDSQIAHWIVEAKSEIEKMREQIQNVE